MFRVAEALSLALALSLTGIVILGALLALPPLHQQDSGPKDVAIDYYDEDEYHLPESLQINRLEPADDRIPAGSNVTLELNVSNEGNETVEFSPPLFLFDQDDEFLLDSGKQINVTLEPGETVHREVSVGRVNRTTTSLWVGIGWENTRWSVGHIEVYESEGDLDE